MAPPGRPRTSRRFGRANARVVTQSGSDFGQAPQRIKRQHALEPSGAHAFDHFVERRVDRVVIGRAPVAARQRRHEHQAPRRAERRCIGHQGVELVERVGRLVHSHQRFDLTANAGGEFGLLLRCRVFRHAGLDEHEQQPLRLLLRPRKPQQVGEIGNVGFHQSCLVGLGFKGERSLPPVCCNAARLRSCQLGTVQRGPKRQHGNDVAGEEHEPERHQPVQHPGMEQRQRRNRHQRSDDLCGARPAGEVALARQQPQNDGDGRRRVDVPRPIAQPREVEHCSVGHPQPEQRGE